MATALPRCLFVDIGGVLLTDGWNRQARRRAARHFKLPAAEIENRHRLVFEAFEDGRLTLDDYLRLVVFHQKRPFTRAEFRRFMFAQSQRLPGMIELVTRLKQRYRLKVVVVSNEGRELNARRIRQFRLAQFVDTFISSSFVHVRKPDAAIFRMALDVAQVQASQVVYIENTPLFVEIGKSMGMRCVLHTDLKSTRARLAALGLRDDADVRHVAR
jgi:putative hydrolase of the HAD superfamily